MMVNFVLHVFQKFLPMFEDPLLVFLLLLAVAVSLKNIVCFGLRVIQKPRLLLQSRFATQTTAHNVANHKRNWPWRTRRGYNTAKREAIKTKEDALQLAQTAYQQSKIQINGMKNLSSNSKNKFIFAIDCLFVMYEPKHHSKFIERVTQLVEDASNGRAPPDGCVALPSVEDLTEKECKRHFGVSRKHVRQLYAVLDQGELENLLSKLAAIHERKTDAIIAAKESRMVYIKELSQEQENLANAIAEEQREILEYEVQEKIKIAHYEAQEKIKIADYEVREKTKIADYKKQSLQENLDKKWEACEAEYMKHTSNVKDSFNDQIEGEVLRRMHTKAATKTQHMNEVSSAATSTNAV